MSDNNTDPEDTGQISVAELLARNGQKTTGISSGGRRRRGVKGGISVAELTGEIPVVRAEPVSDEAPVIASEPAKPEAAKTTNPQGGAPVQSRGKRQPEPELLSGSTTAAGDLLNQAHDESARRPYGSTGSQRPTPATVRKTGPVEPGKSADTGKSGGAAKPDDSSKAGTVKAGDADKDVSTAKPSERAPRTAGFVARSRTRSADAEPKTDITPKQPDAPAGAGTPTPEVTRPKTQIQPKTQVKSKTQAFGKVEPASAKSSDAATTSDSATAASATAGSTSTSTASTSAAATAAVSSTTGPATSKLEVGQAEGTESKNSESTANSESTVNSESTATERTASESAPAGSGDDAVTEIVDAVQDDDETHRAGKKDAAKQWLVLAGQAVVAVIVGALLFKGFERLWDVLPWVALILAVLVIVGLVAVVRILRRTDDLISIVIAIAVGVFVTLGPLAFQLSTG